MRWFIGSMSGDIAVDILYDYVVLYCTNNTLGNGIVGLYTVQQMIKSINFVFCVDKDLSRALNCPKRESYLLRTAGIH